MTVLGADGLNFSVPIDSISKIMEHFERNGYVIHFKSLSCTIHTCIYACVFVI